METTPCIPRWPTGFIKLLWLVVLTACAAPGHGPPTSNAKQPTAAGPSPETQKILLDAENAVGFRTAPCEDTGNANDLLAEARNAVSAGDEVNAQRFAAKAISTATMYVNNCYLAQAHQLVLLVSKHSLNSFQIDDLNTAKLEIQLQHGAQAYNDLVQLQNSFVPGTAIPVNTGTANIATPYSVTSNPALSSQGSCGKCCEDKSAMIILFYPKTFVNEWSFKHAELYVDADYTRLSNVPDDMNATAMAVGYLDETSDPTLELGPLNLKPTNSISTISLGLHRQEQQYSWTITSPGLGDAFAQNHVLVTYLPPWRDYQPTFKITNQTQGCNQTIAASRDYLGKDLSQTFKKLTLYNWWVLFILVLTAVLSGISLTKLWPKVRGLFRH